ncbi:MAG: hypothetical protein ACRDRZ_12895 [Pseudonocardiaceae bacterium]
MTHTGGTTPRPPGRSIVGFCPRCDRPMWAARYAELGFRVRDTDGVCSQCPLGAHRATLSPDHRARLERGARLGSPQARRELVLRHWARVEPTGVSMRDAAAQLGLRYEAFCQMIQRARAAGDPRAPRREQRGASTRQGVAVDWDDVLTEWDLVWRPEGLDWRQAAERADIAHGTFQRRMRRSARAGDPRATRPDGHRRPRRRGV